MRFLALLLSFSFLSISTEAQNIQFWNDVEKSAVPEAIASQQTIIPNEFRSVKFDFKALSTYLIGAPMKIVGGLNTDAIELLLPYPDGSNKTFVVVESPNMEAGISARYPSIKSYSGYCVDEPYRKLNLVVSPIGIHGVIDNPEGQVYLDPYFIYEKNYVQSYYTKDYHPDLSGSNALACGTKPEVIKDEVERMTSNATAALAKSGAGEIVIERTYRAAIATTGEWTSSYFNSNVEDALAGINVCVARVNSIWERDISCRLILIDKNDFLIQVDAGLDPYTNTNNGGALLGQNTAVINSILNIADYDIGHVFNDGCNVGGIASLGSVCGLNKGAGVTCFWGGNAAALDFISAGTVAHEMGHQMRANHTFNSCPIDGQDDNVNSGTGFEPGSGSTIMSYNGACDQPQNVPGGRLDIYHPGTLGEIRSFATVNAGDNCATKITSSNTSPDIAFPYEDDFYIPISTPFMLEVEASDVDDDVLQYSIEQINFGNPATMGQPVGNSPLFRVNYPNSDNFRYFPRLPSVINNISAIEEVLPTYTRNLLFRAVARDYNPEIGGITWDDVSFESTDEAGPFLVNYPNTSVLMEAGSTQEITWDVANTDGELVNCKFVNILLSTNGGLSFPTMLAENVINDGSHNVVIPDLITGLARIKIEAVGNIFYDMSNANFDIAAPAEPAYNFTAAPYYHKACLPSVHSIDVNTLSFLNYDSPITFEINGLPAGAIANFSSNTVNPGEALTVDFDMENVDVTEEIEVEIMGISESLDTVYQKIFFNIISNNFDAIELTAPAQSAEGIEEAPLFEWLPSPNAETYNIEIASSPSFSSETMLLTGEDLVDPLYQADVLLGKNIPIYWRIAPINDCGVGPWSAVNVFHTETFACNEFGDENLNTIIPVGAGEISHTITFFEDGTINDFNIANLDLLYSPVTFLELSITGPQGDKVELMSGICGGTSAVNIGFDNESPTDIPCPPITGLKHKPTGDLSVFNGQNVKGDWILTVKTNGDAFDPGKLRGVQLEICSNLTPAGPVLVNNNVLGTQPNSGQTFEPSFLLVEDQNNSPIELIYTLVEGLNSGELRLNGTVMENGDQFSQININQGGLKYFHNGNDATDDSFFFTVTDGEGGFIGKTEFLISIDPNNPVLGTEDFDLVKLSIFPNPANQSISIDFPTTDAQAGILQLVDVQGRMIERIDLAPGQLRQEVNTSGYTSGIYFVQWLKDNAIIASEKLIIQH